jgi:hypothetical protein
VLATTTAHTALATEALVDAPFAGGPLTLQPGRYVATVVQPAGSAEMPLVHTASVYTPNTSWAIWDNTPFGDWIHIEQADPDYDRTPQVSLLLGSPVLFKDGFE